MMNILVCDDDKEIVEAIEIYLMQEGYRVLKAYDGIQALEQHGFRGAVMDCVIAAYQKNKTLGK